MSELRDRLRLLASEAMELAALARELELDQLRAAYRMKGTTESRDAREDGTCSKR